MNKTIGILTMQRGHNYGSFLQAFSLKKTIESLGSEIIYIDIEPGEDLTNEKVRKLCRLKRNFIRLFKYNFHIPKLYNWINELTKSFNSDQNKYMKLSATHIYESDKIDGLVIGSDEVFNCTDESCGFRPQLLGEGFESIPVASYAGSCGFTTEERIEKYGLTKRVSDDFNSFKYLSVRDRNTHNVIKNLTGRKDILVSLDPVLIYDYKGFIPDSVPLTNYIVIYSYLERIKGEEVAAIKKFAKKYNKKIVSIYSYYKWADLNITPNSFEVLAYFRDADYVFTDTFHGTIFSIKMNKQFGVFVRESNYNKLYYILERFGLTHRFIKILNKAEKIVKDEIDFDPINSVIREETIKSKEYLKEFIESI